MNNSSDMMCSSGFHLLLHFQHQLYLHQLQQLPVHICHSTFFLEVKSHSFLIYYEFRRISSKSILSIICHLSFHIFTTFPFSAAYHFRVWGSVPFIHFIFFFFLSPRHSYSLSSSAILIHSHHLPYSMLFYTKRRIQQLVATTSICFLASHEDMLIFQRGGGIATHDGCFLFSLL